MFLPRHICAMTWHHATFDDFLVSLGFMGIQKPRFEMFEDEPGHQYGCNLFPFLEWDLNMHPRTHVWFLSHFGWLKHVFVVWIWIMDIKCLENLINIWPNEPWTVSNISTTLLLFYVACRKQNSSREEVANIIPLTRGACFPTRTTRVARSFGL